MLLGEPSRTQGDIHFVLFGVPVRVHPMFWLAALVLGSSSRGPAEIAAWILVFFAAILVHELGHAAAMRMYGLRPWIVLYGFGGLTTYSPALVTNRRLGPLERIFMSAAGPLAGFLFALAVAGVLQVTGHGVSVFRDGFEFLIIPSGFGSKVLVVAIINFFYISVFWGVINLLPILPLDGGQIARDVLTLINPGDGLRQALMLSVATAVLVAAVGWIQLQSLFMALFFAYLAYQNLTALQGRP